MIPDMLRIEQRGQDGVQIVELHGEAGAAEAWEVGAVVKRLIETHPGKLILDMSELSFISSMALGELIHLANEVAQYHGRIALAAMQPRVQQVLRLLRFERHYELYDSVEAAVAALKT